MVKLPMTEKEMKELINTAMNNTAKELRDKFDQTHVMSDEYVLLRDKFINAMVFRIPADETFKVMEEKLKEHLKEECKEKEIQ